MFTNLDKFKEVDVKELIKTQRLKKKDEDNKNQCGTNSSSCSSNDFEENKYYEGIYGEGALPPFLGNRNFNLPALPILNSNIRCGNCRLYEVENVFCTYKEQHVMPTSPTCHNYISIHP
ncbi:hypothetical protein N356_gp013 [Cellulophaga phage phi14:2]|nr:hypothetical protein N356_gp013 [Cellulophaga phage phi14:2]